MRQPGYLWYEKSHKDGDDKAKWSGEGYRQISVVPRVKEIDYGKGFFDCYLEESGIRAQGGTAVDFGCGSAMYRNLFRGMTYLGIDQNPDMIAISNTRWSGREEEVGGKSAHFFMTPLTKITDVYPSLVHSADVGLFITVLQHNHFDTAALILQQAAKVLKPGGALMLMEGTYDERYFPEHNRKQYNFPPIDPEDLESSYGMGVFTSKGWLNFLTQNGFENPEYDGSSYYTAISKG